MARLLEHQGKEVLRRFGIPTPEGQVVHDLGGALDAADQIGYPVVVKAQVLSGKRGKAGGVRVASDAEQLRERVTDILSREILGRDVTALLVEERIDIRRELYLAVASDPNERAPVLIFCGEGGVDIEEAARLRPEAVQRLHVDIGRGVYPYDVMNLLQQAPLASTDKLRVATILCGLYEAYRTHDCKLAEINPLALTDNGPVALDARVDIDGDALERQAGLGLDVAEEAGRRSPTQLEEIAGTIDAQDHRGTVHFVQIDPDLSYVRREALVPFGFDCVGAGASLTMMDELVPLGFYPVNFCDTSGNPVGSKLYRVTKLIFSQPGIEGYVFVSCVSSQQLDNTARGIIKALTELYPESGGQPNIPTVLAFRGAWDEKAQELLEEHGIAAGRWVRVFGRHSTEREIARAFHALHTAWEAERQRGAP